MDIFSPKALTVGPCRLCGTTGPLRHSHIVPGFVIQWLKDTGTGYLRQAVNPNKRLQDGPKAYMLCESCEQRFSTREAYFASTVFYPLVNGQTSTFQYDERLFYCFISILWRAAVVSLSRPKFSTHKFSSLVTSAERDWREYLLGKASATRFDEVHVFFTDVPLGQTIPERRFVSYLTRSIDMTVASSESRCTIYVKFGRVLLFGHLTAFESGKWIRTKVERGGGILSPPQGLEDGTGDFLLSRVRATNREFDSRVNEKTMETIERHYRTVFPRMIGSDLFRAQEADFTRAVVPPGRRGSDKVGRNDLCPCGSGKKFKHCHGR